MSAAELSYIEEAFRTNYIAPVGPHVDLFEKEFAAHFGFKHAAAVSSGTAAIHLGLILMGVQRGDEVVCSSLTFAASANPILYEQARPVFVDSDDGTWNMDPVLLESWLAQRSQSGRLPRVVIAVDLYGQCADMRAIAAVCARYNVPLLEDAAEALGASYAGRAAGSFGKAAIFSFNGNKIITTSGGGMLVSDDAELIRKARFLSTQARDPVAHYQHSQLGFNYRMSNVLAGIGRAQLQVLDERVEARRRIYGRYLEGLGQLPGLRFMPEAPRSRSNRWLTCLTIDPAQAPIGVKDVLSALEKENIEARPVWKPLHLQPIFAGCEFVGSGVAQRLFEQGLCLPSGSAMSVVDQMRVIDIVKGCFEPPSVRISVPATKEQADATAEPVPPLRQLAASQVRETGMKMVRGLLHWSDRNIGRHSLTRLAVVTLIHGLMLGATFAVSYQLRWDFAVPANFSDQCLSLIFPIVLCKLILLYSFGQFRSMLSYFSVTDFGSVACAMSTVSGLMLGLWYASAVMAAPPRAVILMDFALSMGLISAFRLGLRVARVWGVSGEKRAGLMEKRVIVVGVGRDGANFARNLLQRAGCGLVPVCFLDENTANIGRSIHGLPVYGPLPKLAKIAARLKATELVIAEHGISPARIKEIVEQARQAALVTQIAPTVSSDRPVTVGPIVRPVAIEDLLGRAEVQLDGAEVARLIRGQVVLVTGAGGSIGSELCRQILRYEPGRLILVDQAEIALFEIEQELGAGEHAGCLQALIVDVADESAVSALLRQWQPRIIFHAAAHKHLPLMERQPAEAVKNNTLATAAFARTASEMGVEWFVFISTDKAINPTSVMGCSKRLAELALQAQQVVPGNRTRFLAVRFGNVLGSSGSVIPVFRRQIAQGGPVTVTHAEMKRYFMTIPEAVGLVLQTVTLGTGGEIFVLDMSDPVKIIDLARQMIELSGYRPGVDIEIKITGLRPGEKLFEELQHTSETHELTAHPRIFRLRAEAGAGSAGWLAELREASTHSGGPSIKQLMKRLVPEYQPSSE